jgi:hypothetical protein
MSFTGVWELNRDLTTTQVPLLKLMGRPDWQISVIDKAQERFRLLHYSKGVHYIHKNVHIHLDSKVLDWVSKLSFGLLPFNQVTYNHWLIANNKLKSHPDDEKHFGPCESQTSFEPGKITIRWRLKRGLLHVEHRVNAADQLEVTLVFTDGSTNQHARAVKIYDRRPLTAKDELFIQSQKEHLPFLKR